MNVLLLVALCSFFAAGVVAGIAWERDARAWRDDIAAINGSLDRLEQRLRSGRGGS